ncbi:transcriptional repressor [Kocuria coralli]|uniref:Transcriptional repressor n=1 Tax=Kocuria coralli TaxID=1461025 RepID=A0A5J5L0S5_9MICC|nr:Fur family transcriptional regulator [Kocuria coralli]KAA9395559.1 transcriptional repressor [Kocuria coralli]
MRDHDRLHGESADASVERAAARLRERGERLTAARRGVLEVLARHTGHLSADEVAVELDRSNGSSGSPVHRTTVYRTLERFFELGILSHRQLPGGASAYHLAAASHLHGHCARCDTVVALDPGAFDRAAESVVAVTGFALDLQASVLVGLCEGCRAPSR